MALLFEVQSFSQLLQSPAYPGDWINSPGYDCSDGGFKQANIFAQYTLPLLDGPTELAGACWA